MLSALFFFQCNVCILSMIFYRSNKCSIQGARKKIIQGNEKNGGSLPR